MCITRVGGGPSRSSAKSSSLSHGIRWLPHGGDAYSVFEDGLASLIYRARLEDDIETVAYERAAGFVEVLQDCPKGAVSMLSPLKLVFAVCRAIGEKHVVPIRGRQEAARE